jgi:hypothetical protein
VKIIHTRCPACGSKPAFMHQNIDDVRKKVCERCGVQLVVTGSEGEDDPISSPVRELCFLTEAEQADARRLIESVVGKE